MALQPTEGAFRDYSPEQDPSRLSWDELPEAQRQIIRDSGSMSFELLSYVIAPGETPEQALFRYARISKSRRDPERGLWVFLERGES